MSSKVGWGEILHKPTIFGVVIVAAQIDAALGLQAIWRTGAIAFYKPMRASVYSEMPWPSGGHPAEAYRRARPAEE